MEQPESLIPLSLSFAGPQRFFQQDIFPPAQGTFAQPDSKNTGQCLFTLTPEKQLIFFLSSHHITISYKCPTKILSHMSCWNAHWVWLRQKDPPQLQPWTPPPRYLWCISAPSLCFWSKSLFSFTAMHDGGLGEPQILPAIPGAAGAPRTNRSDYLSCAQMPLKRPGPRCNKKRTVSC